MKRCLIMAALALAAMAASASAGQLKFQALSAEHYGLVPAVTCSTHVNYGTVQPYVTQDCTPGQCMFFHTVLPGDAPNNPVLKNIVVHWLTAAASPVNPGVAWQVAATATPPSTAYQSITMSGWSAGYTQPAEAANKLNEAWVPQLAIKDMSTGTACAGTACSNRQLTIEVCRQTSPVCGGDCNEDGITLNTGVASTTCAATPGCNEVTTAANILSQVAGYVLASCPAAFMRRGTDGLGNMITTSAEYTAAWNNAVNGCPSDLGSTAAAFVNMQADY